MSRDQYLRKNKDPYKNEDGPRPIKPAPTEQEYSGGQFTRYFIQRVTDPNIIHEIDKKQYDTLSTKKGINGNMWKSVSFPWRLTGRMHDEYNKGIKTYAGVHESNKSIIERNDKKMTGLISHLTDYLEYAKLDNTNIGNDKTTINENHFHYLNVDESGNGWTSEAVNPKNPHIRHLHKVENWTVIESQSSCYPNCTILYGYPGAPPHIHELE